MVDKNKKYKPKTETKFLDQLGKIPPQAVELEQAVLGAILVEPRCLDTVIKDFTETLFYNDQFRIVAGAIIEMYHENNKIDILTVCQRLRDKKKLDEIGGVLTLTEMTGRVASASHVEFHLKILQQKCLQRQIIQISSKAIDRTYEDNEDVYEVFTELQKELDDSVNAILHFEAIPIREIHLKNIEESKVVAVCGIKSGVVSGLRLVDNLTSGWQKSDLIILAGRPSMGKTAMAISMVVYPSIEKQIPVGIFSLEMSSAQLGGRIESNLSSIDVSKIIKKQLLMGDIVYMEGACQKLLSAPLYIDDTPNISLTELKSKARRLVREKGVKLIVIDYLQLMRSGLGIQNREQEIAEISRGLKGLAKELDIPIIALSQLSRLVESRSDKKPQLSDLRESGQIEQDADMVIFCYRPEYYGINTYEIGNETLDTQGLFLLLVAKHRNGELGEVPLRFIHHLAKVTNHPNWNREEEAPAEFPVETPEKEPILPVNNEFENEGNQIEATPPPEEEDDLPF